jgi:hypothetical protein
VWLPTDSQENAKIQDGGHHKFAKSPPLANAHVSEFVGSCEFAIFFRRVKEQQIFL